MTRPTQLAFCIALALSAQTQITVAAEEVAEPSVSSAISRPGVDPESHHDAVLEAIVVRATPLRQTSDQVIAPVAILSGAELDAAKAVTLGGSTSGLPGVQTTSFGPGVGRPVIRGMDGPRVSILSDGMGAADVSNVSQDHAVSIEPFLANQIEVLKGPRTLLYGPGAIGGIVNVADGRIPESAPANGFSGRAELNLDSVSDGRTGMARLDAGSDNFAVHVDGLHRRTDDFETPVGLLENSAIETRAGAIGASVFGDWGFVGASISRFLTDYGLPIGAHAHDHDDHDDHAGEGDHDDDDHDDEEFVRIGMRQTRHDIKAGLNDPFPGVQTLRFAWSHTDYSHTEFEGHEVGTRFFADTNEFRTELVHAPLAGWRGVIGVQASDRDFEAIGEEAFVPPTRTRNLGLFLTEQREWDRLVLEFGARADRTRLRPGDFAGHDHDDHDEGDDHVHDLEPRSFTSTSFSLGARWRLDDAWHLNLNLDRAQRAPVEEELFADGPHIATASFEVGDDHLGKETANQAELGVHFHSDRVEAKFAAFVNRFNDYIYLADTGLEEDDLPVRQWTQADARFHGFEGEAIFHLSRRENMHWDLRVWGDTVRARLSEGGNLPRIPAARFGTSLLWKNDVVRASIGAVRYFEQDNNAELESATAGFTLVNAHAAWMLPGTDRGGLEIFANANNLTDRTARLSTSYIKDIAPLPGRSIVVGVRTFF